MYLRHYVGIAGSISFGSPPAGRHRTTSTVALSFQADEQQEFAATEI